MRIEGRIKMGYYPTPENVVELVKLHLSFPQEKVNLLDPCCGEGTALHLLADGLKAETYGIELDNARAAKARERLHCLITGSCFQSRITKGAFGLLFLNPPYDDEEGKRLEWMFLRETGPYLKSGGVLVYIVPQKRLEDRIVKYLFSHFADLRLFRFPDPEFETFGQVVLFGEKRKDAVQADIPEEFRFVRYKELSPLGKDDDFRYAVPAGGKVAVFRSEEMDPAELEKGIAKSPLWERVKRNLVSVTPDKRTPLPLHRGHLGLLLAAGKLDGVQGEGSDRHLVRGKVEKAQTVTEQENEDGSRETRVLESFRVAVKILTRAGEIRVLA